MFALHCTSARSCCPRARAAEDIPAFFSPSRNTGQDRYSMIGSSRAACRPMALAFLFLVTAGSLGAQAAEPFDAKEVAPGVFVHQGRHEVFSPQNEGDIA